MGWNDTEDILYSGETKEDKNKRVNDYKEICHNLKNKLSLEESKRKENLRQNLIGLRKYHHYTKAELAEILEISRVTIHKWETGEIEPSAEILRTKIKELYHLGSYQGGRDEPYPVPGKGDRTPYPVPDWYELYDLDPEDFSKNYTIPLYYMDKRFVLTHYSVDIRKYRLLRDNGTVSIPDRLLELAEFKKGKKVGILAYPGHIIIKRI